MIGDQDDIFHRLRRLLPASWFKGATPNIDALLQGLSNGFAPIYSLNAYARAQMRLQTTTDGFLDLAAWDFFGPNFFRRAGETDAQFMPRLVAEIRRPRLTKAAIIGALYDLTGNTATIIEPFNPGDCGAYDVGTLAYAGQTLGYGNGGGYDTGLIGLDTAGCFFVDQTQPAAYSGGAGAYGDTNIPTQFFLTLARPGLQGIPNASGFDCSAGGYDAGGLEYIDPSMVTAPVSDQEIYNCINETKAAGTTCWIRLTGTAPVADDSFDASFGQSSFS